MITLVEALNYRVLRYVRQPLGRFNVLVGANATGKTTFLDVIAFLGSLIADNLESTLADRCNDLNELLWDTGQNGFELAVEAEIPSRLRPLWAANRFQVIRYEIKVGKVAGTGEYGLLAEKVTFRERRSRLAPNQLSLFPDPHDPPFSIHSRKGTPGVLTIVSKTEEGSDNFRDEITPKEEKRPWRFSFKLGPRKSALANLPGDESKFPVSTWLKESLTTGLQELTLNSLRIRRPSPPGRGTRYLPDGSNLPWVVEHLRTTDAGRYSRWLDHVRTALPDLEGVSTVLRPEDMHRYLVLHYNNGKEVPSWAVSDGTLRLLALTLIAYLPNLGGIWLIEEPENGIHPKALDTVVQSLSSVYDAQVLLATHAPVVLNAVGAEDILCFAKTSGATAIVRGTEHPALANWRGHLDLGTLLAAGVLE